VDSKKSTAASSRARRVPGGKQQQQQRQRRSSNSKNIEVVGKENKRVRGESLGSSKIKKAVGTIARDQQEGRAGIKKSIAKRAKSGTEQEKIVKSLGEQQ
jgi:hypothetical protein